MFIADLLKKVRPVEDMIPRYGVHVTPMIVPVGDDRLLMVFRLAGMPFESIDGSLLNNRFDALNKLLSSLGKKHGSKLSLWTHVHHRPDTFKGTFNFRSSFMRGFASRYLARFDRSDYFTNDFYLSLLLKYDDIDDGIKELTDLGALCHKALGRYDPEPLSIYERNGLVFSEVYTFLGVLLNGTWEEVPVTAAPAYDLVPSSWLHFGYDVLEVRGTGFTKFGACFDLKDFPDKTKRGLFNPALTLPYEFVLTQSFGYLGLAEAERAIDTQLNKLKSVGEETDDMHELNEAKNGLKAGSFSLGEYHGALVVFGPAVPLAAEKPVVKAAAKAAKANGTEMVATMLTECGARFVEATLSAPLTYLSQAPGFKDRPRMMPKSSRNLVGAFSLHNYSTGKAVGNPIGDGTALMPLKTKANSLFHLNLHFSKLDEDSTGKKIAGHSLWLGSTGVGKTTAQLAAVGFLERFDSKLFVLDNKAGTKIFILATGGEYLEMKAGEPTGLAPFQLPDTPYNRDALYALVSECGADGAAGVSDEEAKQVKFAVDTIMALPREQRRFSLLLQSIPDNGPNCLARRLHKWCYVTDGQYAWALDNAESAFDLDALLSKPRLGFDVTDFLKEGYQPTGPVLGFLLHLKTLMQRRGGLLATVIEEFWLPLMFPICAKAIRYALKTGRKEDEFLMLVSQSPEDAINSPIFADIVQMTQTQVYLPNPRASFESYQKCGLNATEFADLAALSEDSRTMLIKQGNQSAFAVLDLTGMDDDLAVLSGSPDNVAILDEVVAEVGSDPDIWMPVFQQRRVGKRAAQLPTQVL